MSYNLQVNTFCLVLGSLQMAELPVLTYFDGRGRAEIIRIMLCAGKIKVRTSLLLDDIDFYSD